MIVPRRIAATERGHRHLFSHIRHTLLDRTGRPAGQDRVDQGPSPEVGADIQAFGHEHDLCQDPGIDEGQAVESVSDAMALQNHVLVEDKEPEDDPEIGEDAEDPLGLFKHSTADPPHPAVGLGCSRRRCYSWGRRRRPRIAHGRCPLLDLVRSRMNADVILQHHFFGSSGTNVSTIGPRLMMQAPVLAE